MHWKLFYAYPETSDFSRLLNPNNLHITLNLFTIHPFQSSSTYPDPFQIIIIYSQLSLSLRAINQILYDILNDRFWHVEKSV
jgi:hypothetical protein